MIHMKMQYPSHDFGYLLLITIYLLLKCFSWISNYIKLIGMKHLRIDVEFGLYHPKKGAN